MNDLISRQAAIERIEAVFPVDPIKSEYAQGIAVGAALAKTYVEQLPSAQTADAVEVVRCKDCDNFQTDWETAFANGRHYCAVMDSIMPPDGFCSYGERKINDS